MSRHGTLAPNTRVALERVAAAHDTPCYVYDAGVIRARVSRLNASFGGRLALRYAVKANPNPDVLALLHRLGALLDASSAGEARMGLAAGHPPDRIAFTGPAKRRSELEMAVREGMEAVVAESVEEIDDIDAIAASVGRVQTVRLRVRPAAVAPGFGLRMNGPDDHFGIAEAEIDTAVEHVRRRSCVRLDGLHAYPAGNSLDATAVASQLFSLLTLFADVCRRNDIEPACLTLGSGFGIPYFANETELELGPVARRLCPALDELRAESRFAATRAELELGRWVAGPAGWLLTRVVRAKRVGERDVLLCDAGFNNHLAAAGMMGTVLRRDWPIHPVTHRPAPSGSPMGASETVPCREYRIVGPLCASFDVLATAARLPPTGPGDVLAVGASGAYGLTASPTRFIGHPEPREHWIESGDPDGGATETGPTLGLPATAGGARP